MDTSDITYDDLYQLANEVFDEEVFDGNDLIDVYNDWPDGEANELLHDIVYEMVDEARKSLARAMKAHLETRKGEFFKLLRQKWACPDCSTDEFGYVTDYVVLDHVKGGWECPKCGCFTSAPEEDLCFDLSEEE